MFSGNPRKEDYKDNEVSPESLHSSTITSRVMRTKMELYLLSQMLLCGDFKDLRHFFDVCEEKSTDTQHDLQNK